MFSHNKALLLAICQRFLFVCFGEDITELARLVVGHVDGEGLNCVAAALGTLPLNEMANTQLPLKDFPSQYY